ncbi:MAG: NAD(P)H:quinone oxidoreductase [Porticoccaceae bacterium]|nr:NAD(P)H:quinone oxidoreductase [Porticoccaceae bacterium]
MSRILVLYYSRFGATAQMAELIADGIESVAGCEAMLRTVPSVSPDNLASEPKQPEQGPIYCSETDFKQCDGLILGSPTRFGNMAAPLKYFIDGTGSAWMEGSLVNKPAACFTSSSSMHGGQESTLLSMSLPLIHHGMLFCGIPFTATELSETKTGGTPYGASHLAGGKSDNPISDSEAALCKLLGTRVAKIASAIEAADL